MNRDPGASEQLARSWDANAGAWTRAVRNGSIESRRVTTDQAIINAVTARSPRRVLDVGCGEGWLSRRLSVRGIQVVGIDGSAALIETAHSAGGGEFHHLSFEALAASPEQLGLSCFDVVVCNFSLLGEDLEPLLRSLAAVLHSSGVLLIQTVHPWIAADDHGYASSWRTETFQDFNEEFAEPMPWYFRTLEAWVEVLLRSDFSILELQEPLHPRTKQPLSLLFALSRSGA